MLLEDVNIKTIMMKHILRKIIPALLLCIGVPIYAQINYKIVIDCQFDDVARFASNGLAAVKKGGKWGYIDQTGKVVIDYQFDEAYNFAPNGLARVEKEYLYGFIDKTGKAVIDYQFIDAGDFAVNDLACVKDRLKYGYIDKTGKPVIDFVFYAGWDFDSLGYARVMNDKKEIAYIDQSGKLISDYKFDEAGNFAANGLANVRIGGKWAYIDRSGETVIFFLFDKAGEFAPNNLAAVQKGGKFGYIDSAGSTAINYRFKLASVFAPNGLALVSDGSNFGYIDKSGKEKIDYIFNDAFDFTSNGLARVYKVDASGSKGKYGFIDQSGKLVIDCLFDDAQDFSSSGLAAVFKDDKWGYILANPIFGIEDYLNNEINKWQVKGKYETTDAYKARVDESSRKKKQEELLDRITQDAAMNFTNWKNVKTEYNADKKTYKIDVEGISPFYLKVPINEAVAFDAAIQNIKLQDLKYRLGKNGLFILQKAILTNPDNGKVYKYVSDKANEEFWSPGDALQNSQKQVYVSNLKQVPENIHKKVPENIHKQVPENNQKQIPENNQKQISENNQKQLPENKLNQVPDNGSTVVDIDGNVYKTLIIGTQEWMAENLKTTRYNDGTPIPLVIDNNAWANLETGAYCWYNNSENNKEIYGALYNGAAVNNNQMVFSTDKLKNVCPAGWHVPSYDDWKIMDKYLNDNGYTYDGRHYSDYAKSLASTGLWKKSIYVGSIGNSDYPSLQNKSGFSALPGGARVPNGEFTEIGSVGYFWSSEFMGGRNAFGMYIESIYSQVSIRPYSSVCGNSVRCLKDINVSIKNSEGIDKSVAIKSPLPLTNGLVAFYPFNGNANDESGNANNGIIFGATLTTDRSGRSNSAYYFDGKESYIKIPSNALLNLPKYTIALWVSVERYKGSDAEGGHIFSKGIYPNYNYVLAAGNLDRTNTLNTSTTHNGNFKGFQSRNTFFTDTWYFFVVINDGNDLKIFVNDSFNGSIPIGMSSTNNNDIYIGRYEGTAFWNFKGKIDDIRIYNRALAENEIHSLYTEDKESSHNNIEKKEITYSPSVQNRTMTWTKGSTYEGDIENNVPNGKGKLTFTDGVVYIGDFVNGKRQGNGKLTYADGSYYKGDWFDDAANGKGEMTYEAGGMYIGDFVNGKSNGQGKTILKDGSTYYEGNYVNNLRQGKGKMYYKNGRTMADGDWVNGDINGTAKFYDENGRLKYEGEWRDNNMEGKGKMYYDNGDIYEGDFISGKMNGSGKYSYPNGYIYFGEFINNKPTGKGKMVDTNNNIIEGELKDGVFIEVAKESVNTKSDKEKTTIQNNRNSQDNITNQDDSKKSENKTMVEQILDRLTPQEVAFFHKVTDTYDSDPQHKEGQDCGLGTAICKWCGKEFTYQKTYVSMITYIKALSDTMGDLLGTLGLGFAKLFTDEDPIEKLANEVKDELKAIRNNNFYSCPDSPPDFCSEKCKYEYSDHH